MRMDTSSSVSPCFTVVNADRGPVGAGDEVGGAGGGGFGGWPVRSAAIPHVVASVFGAEAGSRVAEPVVEGAGLQGEMPLSRQAWEMRSGQAPPRLVDPCPGDLAGSSVAGRGSSRTTGGGLAAFGTPGPSGAEAGAGAVGGGGGATPCRFDSA